MDEEFYRLVQQMVDQHGEAHTREYIKTYCGVMLDDPSLPDHIRTKVLGVLEFFDEDGQAN